MSRLGLKRSGSGHRQDAPILKSRPGLAFLQKLSRNKKKTSQIIFNAISEGRRPIFEEAEGSLGKLVNGYDYTETDTLYETDATGKPVRVVSVKVMKRRHHPELRAINYLLKQYENQTELDI